MASTRPNMSHVAPIPGGPPNGLPAQAAARAHSEFARIVEQYGQAWRFVGHPEPTEDYSEYVAACDGLPANWTQLKVYHAGTEVTVLASTAPIQ